SSIIIYIVRNRDNIFFRYLDEFSICTRHISTSNMKMLTASQLSFLTALTMTTIKSWTACYTVFYFKILHASSYFNHFTGKFMPECHTIHIWSKFMEPGNIRTTNPNGLHFNDYIVIFFDNWFFRIFKTYILFSVKI